MEKITCTIGITGDDNIRILCDYIGNQCYRAILEHNNNIGQIEWVLDDLVVVTWVPASKVNKVLDTLRKIGVSGTVTIETDGIDYHPVDHVYLNDGTKSVFDAIAITL